MAGILDKKYKLIDLVVTQEGRRQMSQGGFSPTYASFSDRNAIYDSTNTSILHTSQSLYFQTPTALSDDQIVYETDDSGKLVVGDLSDQFTIIGDDLFKKDSSVTGSNVYASVSGSQFASTVKLVKDRTIESFKRNKFIRTVSGFNSNKDFKLNIENYNFAISNSVPWPLGPDTGKIDIDSTETFMFDSKLAHNRNFQFLPPQNEDGTAYGEYEDLRSTTRETFADIKNHLGITIMEAYEPLEQADTVFDYAGDIRVKNRAPNAPIETVISREFATIYFKDGGEQNNIIAQMYEEEPAKGTVTKLDVVDAGQFYDEDDEEKPTKHVFYAGKIMFDSLNIPSFINFFTIIFD
jgi:hypothetical protein